MNILSLFDGMSGARLALDDANIKVKNYYASEIDKYAITVSKANYPDIKHIGSVTELTKKQLKKMKIDLLVGGSPCQGFSMAGKRKGTSTKDGVEITTLKQYKKLKKDGFEFDGQSYLFWEYIRVLKILKKYNPKLKFLLENVRVTKKWLPMFNKATGVDAIFINSNLLTAQNRPRYYWTDIKGVKQPKDKGIFINDILEDIPIDNELSPFMTGEYGGICRLEKGIFNFTDNKKAYCLSTGSNHPNKYLIHKSVKPSVAKNIKEQHDDIITSDKDIYTMECTSGFQDNKIGLKKTPCLRAGNNSTYVLAHNIYGGFKETKPRIFKEKSPTLRANSGGGSIASVIPEKDIENISLQLAQTYRKLTPLECERLQGVPDNYTNHVSNTQRYKMIGNGFTIPVISHIFKGLK